MDSLAMAFGAGIITLLYALWLAFSVNRAPSGEKKMQEISGAIREGADAFLMRQYKTLIPIVVILAAASNALSIARCTPLESKGSKKQAASPARK